MRHEYLLYHTENNQCDENLFRKVREPKLLQVKKDTDDTG